MVLHKNREEELARKLYGEENEPDVTEEEPEVVVVDPLPELISSEWYEQKIQVTALYCA